MKRFQSILCASLLTAAMASTVFAGNITTKPGNITTAPGNITTKPGNITTAPGNISGITWSVIESIITLVGVIG